METYLLGETVARCMNPECRKEWTRRMLMDTMTKSFVATKYRDHLKNVLYDTQRAMMPETMSLVVIHKYHDELNTKCVEQTHLLDTLSQQMHEVKYRIRYLCEERNRIHAGFIQSNDLDTNMVNTLSTQIANGERTMDWVMHGGGWTNIAQTNTTVNAVFQRPCCDPDCRGYLSTQWKCGLCYQWACKDCHRVLGLDRNANEHVCNPDDVATARLLSRDTKSCPSCSTPIYKIDGCDQMWCTQCHTAFSWRSGRIETRIHNPHYYAWLRQNSETGEIPRNAGDQDAGNNVCGNDIHLDQLHTIVGNLRYRIGMLAGETYAHTIYPYYVEYKRTHPQSEYVPLGDMYILLQKLRHLHAVDYQRYHTVVLEHARKNRHLRVAYLQNIIDETTFKTQLQIQNKRYMKHMELCQVLEMFISSVVDIISSSYNIVENVSVDSLCNEEKANTIKRSVDMLFTLNKLVEYTNTCLRDVCTTYQSVKYHISYNFTWTADRQLCVSW